jgi:hypothetical protein
MLKPMDAIWTGLLESLVISLAKAVLRRFEWTQQVSETRMKHVMVDSDALEEFKKARVTAVFHPAQTQPMLALRQSANRTMENK